MLGWTDSTDSTSSATTRTSSAITVSTPPGLPAAVRRAQQHAIEPLVVRAHQQSLPRRPFRTVGISGAEAGTGKTTAQVDHGRLDGRRRAVEQ